MQLSAISLALTRAGIISEFTPKSLFTTGTQGVFYDVSDYANTCFEDSAGTIPITSPLEKPVGLMLDKSQSATFARRLNLLNNSENISSVDWAAYQIASRTTTKFVPTTSNLEHYIANSTSKAAIAIQYSARFDVKDEGYGFAPIVIGDWNNETASNGWYFCVNLSDGSYTSPVTFGSGWPVGTVTITRDSVTGICTVAVVFTTSAVSTRVGIGVYVYPSLKATVPFSFSGNGTSGIYCSKIDLRLASEANTLPLYQPTAQWPVSWTGNHAYQSTTTSRPTLSARKNKLVGTATLATQNATTTAVGHVLSFWGTGTVTLSGTATGSLVGTGVNDRVSLTFTPTAGTLTLTVTGSVLKAQLEEINETV